MRYKNAIFDMDGVLIDNSEGIMYCAEYAINKLGLPPLSKDTLKKFIGPALIWSLKTYCKISEEKAEEGLYIYREKYINEGINMFKLYDGIYDTVKTLCDAGVKCSVSSGKPQESVEYILKKAKMTEFFDAVAGAVFPTKVSSKDEQLKKALIERPAVMIGDRVFDIDSAYNAKIDCIFVTYGFGDDSDLAGHKPQHIVHSPKEILKVIL